MRRPTTTRPQRGETRRNWATAGLVRQDRRTREGTERGQPVERADCLMGEEDVRIHDNSFGDFCSGKVLYIGTVTDPSIPVKLFLIESRVAFVTPPTDPRGP